MRRCSQTHIREYPHVANSTISFLITIHEHKRTISTRGQFNPIHNFSYALSKDIRAKDEKSFEKIITNPGPLRIAYTPDYLDWLYRCYKAKCKYIDARNVAEKKFNGNLVSSEISKKLLKNKNNNNNSNTISGGNDSDDLNNKLPGAPPPGMFLRPPHSFRRIAGEMKRKYAQETLDTVSKSQGMLDLFERQPQFPVIHIDRCSRFHLVELFKEMVLERSLDATSIWDKALIYRAVLSERKPSYPSSFRYIFDAVDDTVFAPFNSNSFLEGKNEENKNSNPLIGKCPTLENFHYFLYLVKKYYIDNAVEAHVVLRCHRESNATDLLFSNPPPKDDAEVRQAIESILTGESSNNNNNNNNKDNNNTSKGSNDTKHKTPKKILPPNSYPPIEALWRCEENIPLLKILLFGEFNLIVSENPFIKYPAAHAFLTKPFSTDASRGAIEGVSLANIISEKRGHLLPSFPRNIANAIDSRAQDLRRLQQKHHREDIIGFQKLLRSSNVEDSPLAYSSYSDWSYFNPRAVRAEARDRLTRKGMEALKLYDSATNDIYRESFDSVLIAHSRRLIENEHTMPTYLPTLPHFVSIIKKDLHISFLMHVGLPDKNSSTEATLKHKELERRIYFLARALYNTALEYHKETVRRINRQKVNVAASLLDDFVQKEWNLMLQGSDEVSNITLVENSKIQEDEKINMARRLGRYMPFANRSLDETGFTTDARAEDFTRWMAAPVIKK